MINSSLSVSILAQALYTAPSLITVLSLPYSLSVYYTMASGSAGSSTGASGSAGSSADSWVACLKKKRRVTDDGVNKQNDGEHEMLLGMLAHFDKHPQDLMGQWRSCRSLGEKHDADARCHADLGTTFKTFGALRQLDEVVVIEIVLSHLDYSYETDMKPIIKFDAEQPYHMLSSMVQVPLKCKLPEQLRLIGLFKAWVAKRMATCRIVASTLKVRLQVAGGKVDWNGIRFKLVWEDASAVKSPMKAGLRRSSSSRLTTSHRATSFIACIRTTMHIACCFHSNPFC